MSFFDWNGDGKKDMLDDIIEFQGFLAVTDDDEKDEGFSELDDFEDSDF